MVIARGTESGRSPAGFGLKVPVSAVDIPGQGKKQNGTISSIHLKEFKLTCSLKDICKAVK